MTTLAELVVALVGDTSEFESSMQGAGASLQSLGSQMTSVGTSLTAGLTLPLAAVGTAAVAMATQFNSGMANIASLSDDARSRVTQWGPDVQAMAVQVGQSTSNLTDGLYQVVSAFGATDDSLAILEINAVAAAAGLATTSEAIGLTSAVTKAYGDTSAGAVQQAADLAQMTVSMGQTTFPELAGAIGAVTPLTAALGVSQQELFAVMATGAGVTGSTSQVATQLRGVLQSLMAPTDAMAGLISDLGYESGQAMIEGMGLDGAIQAIVAAAEASGQPLQSYIGSIEGQTLALALAGPLAGTFAGNIDAMANSAGASAAAFEAQTQGVNAVGFSMQQAAVQVQVWGQQIGQALLPALGALMGAMGPAGDFITRLIAGFAGLSPQTQMVIIGVVGFAAALGPLLVIIGSVVGAVGTLVAGWGAAAAAFTAAGGAAGILGGIITFLTGPIGLVIAAVVALAAAWATNFGGIRDKTAEVWAQVQAIIAPVIAWIQTTIQTVIGAVVAWWNANWPTIQATAQAVWSAVQTGITAAVGLIQGIVMTVIGGLISWWNAAWPPIATVVGQVWGWIQATIQAAAGVIGPVVQNVMAAIGAAIQATGPIIEQFKALWASLAPAFQALQPVVELVGKVIAAILAVLGAAFMALVGVVVGVVQGITAALTPLVQTVMGIVQAVIGIFTGLVQFFTGMWNTIVGLFTGNSQLVQQGMDQMSQGIQTIWTNLVNGVVGLVTGLVNTVIAFVSGLVDGVINFFTSLYQTLVGGSIVPDMVNAIIQWFQTLLATGTAIMQAIQAAIVAIWTAVQAFWQAMWSALQAIAQAGLTAIQTVVTNVLNFLQGFWQGWMNALAGAWGAFLDVMQGLWSTAWSMIAAIFQQALGVLSSIAAAIVSAIFGAFNQDWGSIGRNIVDSIGNALKAGLSWVADQARRIAEAALEAAKRALGIGSPSKEFMYMGEMSIAGMARGMRDVDPVERAVVRGINAGLGAARGAANGTGPVDRSVRIGQVMMAGTSGASVLEQMRAYGR